jgi:hypothetical protein
MMRKKDFEKKNCKIPDVLKWVLFSTFTTMTHSQRRFSTAQITA